MCVTVEKRDGRIVDFDPQYITNAITAAFNDVRKNEGSRINADDERLITDITNTVCGKIQTLNVETVNVEQIQTLVENSLLEDYHLENIFDAFNSYRVKRMKERAKAADPNEAIKRFLRKDKNIMNENANKDSRVYATQRDLLAGAVSKAAALKQLPKDVANAHEKGDIHYHDLE